MFVVHNNKHNTDTSSFSDTENCTNEDWFIIWNDLLGKEGDPPIQTVGELLREQGVAEVGQDLHYYKNLNWFYIIQWYMTKKFKEESGKHDEGMQWWKQFKSYTRHNNVNELWQYFDVMEWCWMTIPFQYPDGCCNQLGKAVL